MLDLVMVRQAKHNGAAKAKLTMLNYEIKRYNERWITMEELTAKSKQLGYDNNQFKTILEKNMSENDALPLPVLETSKSVFDLDSKSYVDVVKIGSFSPVADMQEFVSRLGNDSAKILEIVNDGLKEFERNQLAGNPDVPWQQKDDEGNLTPFSGTLLSEEKSKQLQATVLNFARMLFGYDKKMAEDVETNRKMKKEAKDKALEAILSQPAAVEALKKA